MTYKELDQKAQQVAQSFRQSEAELLKLIMQVDHLKVFRKFGYNSLFQYVHQRLKISESQTYAFIAVARKAHEVPKLCEFIQKGNLNVNKAKRITSVINKDNQDQWLEMAVSQSQKVLERQVAMAQPDRAIQERTQYLVSSTPLPEKVQIQKNKLKIKLEIGLSEKTMLQLRRVQDLVSQKRKESVNLEKTIEALVSGYIQKEDPLEKAKRQKIKGKLQSSPPPTLTPRKQPFLRKELSSKKRKSIPAKIKHLVFLRDQGQCTSISSEGQRCSSRRFLQIHHIQPLSKGGPDSVENLTLLCAGHHSVLHQK